MNDTSNQKKSFWPFVLPLLAYLALGMIEPRFQPDQPEPAPRAMREQPDPVEPPSGVNAADAGLAAGSRTSGYLWIYATRVLLAGAMVIGFFRYYLQQFPLSVTWWSVLVGILGVALWVGVCQLQIETHALGLFGMSPQVLGTRSQFNPWEHFSSAAALTGVLTLRFLGLVIVVPLIEEVFLRGFLIRMIEQPDWWNVKLSQLDRLALLTPCVYGALTHPGEIVAAVLWFGLITILMVRTGRFWDCVVAHAVTNLLLGVYVVAFSQWQLW